MKRIALVTAAALFASAGGYALAQGAGQGTPGQGAPAQTAPAQPQAGQDQQPRRGMSQDEFNRFVDARVASIKAGLKLTPDQERLWAPVESAIRSSAADRYSRFEQRGNQDFRNMDFMQRLERRSAMTTLFAQQSTALSAALRPLWDTFSDEQKRVAPRLMRLDGPMGWGERGGRHGRGGHGRDGDHGRMGGMMQHGGQGMMQHGGPGMMGPGGQQGQPQRQP